MEFDPARVSDEMRERREAELDASILDKTGDAELVNSLRELRYDFEYSGRIITSVFDEVGNLISPFRDQRHWISRHLATEILADGAREAYIFHDNWNEMIETARNLLQTTSVTNLEEYISLEEVWQERGGESYLFLFDDEEAPDFDEYCGFDPNDEYTALTSFLYLCKEEGFQLSKSFRDVCVSHIPNWVHWEMKSSVTIAEAACLVNNFEPRLIDGHLEFLVETQDYVKTAVADGTIPSANGVHVPLKSVAEFFKRRNRTIPKRMLKRYIDDDVTSLEPMTYKMADAADSDGVCVATSRFPNQQWKKYEFEVCDGEKVLVKLDGVEQEISAEQLGLTDGRSGRASLIWATLEQFAVGNGVVHKDEISRLDWSAFSKRKQLLSKKLREYFGIDEDPFAPMQQSPGVRTSRNEGFRTRFRIYAERM